MRWNSGGILLNTLEAARAFALGDLALNHMWTVLFVPKHFNKKYSTAFGRILEELTTTIESAEPGRTKHNGTASRWCAGIPQLLRKPRFSGRAHVVKVTGLRLTSSSEASMPSSSTGGWGTVPSRHSSGNPSSQARFHSGRCRPAK